MEIHDRCSLDSLVDWILSVQFGTGIGIGQGELSSRLLKKHPKK